MTNPNHKTPAAGEPDDDTPMTNLGIAGNLTRAFIKSPLTPLFLIAAFAFGLVALLTLPREEEPQISVPMVDIIVQAPGLRADDAQKLITEPLETIVKSINGVEHIYSQSMDNMVMVTAANELRSRGISVAVISPGWVQTDMGGSGAPLDVKRSAAGIRKVIDKLNVGISGQFFNYSGENLPW